MVSSFFFVAPIQTKLGNWTDLVAPMLDHHAPLVTVTIKYKSGFEVSLTTRNLIRLAANQFQTYRCFGALSDLALYKDIVVVGSILLCLTR